MKLLILSITTSFFLHATMLTEAEKVGQLYAQEVVKTPSPSSQPQPIDVLNLASVWLTLSLEKFPIERLEEEETWKVFKEIGIEGVRAKDLREMGTLDIQAQWKKGWANVVKASFYQGMALIGDLICNSTNAGPDFQQALQNQGDYPDLYQLVEIDSADWDLLPQIPTGALETNIPWLSVQTLHKRGYILDRYTPYVKESSWNATNKIRGVDGKTRRWVYLKEGVNSPVLNWLSPSFAAYRLLSGDALKAFKENGQQILHLDGKMPEIAQSMISLWIRKMGAYSAISKNGTLDSMKNVKSDLFYDAATKPALLHALITEDAEALRMIYRTMLENKIEAKRMVHVLEPYDQNACEWVELMNAPKKKFLYHDEQITGDILKGRLLKEDLARLQNYDRITPTTWVDHCARALNISDFETHREEITKIHLLLAFTYAMQPGVFSISYDDLMGTLPNREPLYAQIPYQLTNRTSFTYNLKNILQARSSSNIKEAELVEVVCSPNSGTLLLLYRQPKTHFMQLLAVNFAREEVNESIEKREFSKTSAINLMSGIAEEKIFSSSQFSFTLPPMSGKAFYFQPKYYSYNRAQ